MTAWDFSPEQREIIEGMIEAALDRRLGGEPKRLMFDDLRVRLETAAAVAVNNGAITLAPASITIDAGKTARAEHFGTGLTFPIEGPE
jgi:hypothetical protein